MWVVIMKALLRLATIWVQHSGFIVKMPIEAGFAAKVHGVLRLRSAAASLRSG
jgi:hypothetical protein